MIAGCSDQERRGKNAPVEAGMCMCGYSPVSRDEHVKRPDVSSALLLKLRQACGSFKKCGQNSTTGSKLRVMCVKIFIFRSGQN